MTRIFLIGYMGSGKTTIGKLLAKQLGFTFLDMDAYIEEKYFKTISQIFATHGETYFREIERKCLHEVALFENTVIATGGGTPCFYDNMEVMNTAGTTVYLKYSAEELANRLSSAANKRPLIAEKKGDELLEFISKTLLTREVFYNKAQHLIFGTEAEIIQRISLLN
jgi:shikimate kinase